MTTDHDDTGHEPHATSATDTILTELQLHGYRPFQDEPDPRPLPDARNVVGAVADIFDALIATLNDTRLEPDLEDLLWSTVNLFHRANARIERQLDDNEQAQRRGQREQDGSEIRSVELERLTAEGMTLIERRNVMELFRDQAAEHFARHTGSHWHPRNGSMVNHRTLTAAMIDSRDFIAAKRRADTEVMLPPGPKVAFSGGLDFNDHCLIWDRLDQVRAKHPDMVLLHGGSAWKELRERCSGMPVARGPMWSCVRVPRPRPRGRRSHRRHGHRACGRSDRRRCSDASRAFVRKGRGKRLRRGCAGSAAQGLREMSAKEASF